MSEKSLRELCAQTGVTRRAVQGYEKAGLVASAGKNKYGHLRYDQAGVERIITIHFFQKIGFSIREIKGIIDAPAAVRKEALLRRREQLEKDSKELSELIRQTEAYIAKL